MVKLGSSASEIHVNVLSVQSNDHRGLEHQHSTRSYLKCPRSHVISHSKHKAFLKVRWLQTSLLSGHLLFSMTDQSTWMSTVISTHPMSYTSRQHALCLKHAQYKYIRDTRFYSYYFQQRKLRQPFQYDSSWNPCWIVPCSLSIVSSSIFQPCVIIHF